jgi:hypothetical protein
MLVYFPVQAIHLQKLQSSIGVIITRKIKQFAQLHIQSRKLENNEYYGWGQHSATCALKYTSMYMFVYFPVQAIHLQNLQSWIGIIITLTMEHTLAQHIQRSTLENNVY